jgi:hypothetical protein
MVKVEAVWYAEDEAQANEMVVMLVEKFLVGVSVSVNELMEDEDDYRE